MGFGDERGNISPVYAQAAESLAAKLYPDMDTIPGGESVRAQRDADKIAAAHQGAVLLRFLDAHGLIDMAQLAQIDVE